MLKRARKPPVQDLIGSNFGMLIVMEMYQNLERNPRGHYFCKCQCKCGNIIEVASSSLKAGRTTSCGCRRDQYDKMRGDKQAQFTGYKEIRGKFWTEIKKKALSRNLSFNITIEYAWELYESQDHKCVLTGLDLVFGKWDTRGTASLDRIDNSKGYEIGNVQWVHKDINIMRNKYDMAYFVSMCKLVALNMGEKE